MRNCSTCHSQVDQSGQGAGEICRGAERPHGEWGRGDGVQEEYPGGEDQPRHVREADDAKKAGEQAGSTLGRDGQIYGEQDADECRDGGQNHGEKQAGVVALAIESGTHLEKIEEGDNEQDEA